MKVLYDYQVFTEQDFGGTSRYISFLNKCIKELGEESKISVLLSNNEYLKEENIGHAFFKNRYFPKKKVIMNFINQQYTIYLLKSGKFDILHAGYYDGYYLKKSDVPVVVTVYDMIHEKLYHDYAELRDDKFIERKKNALNNADLIIAISETTRKDVLEIYPFVSPDKIKTVHLCLMLNNEKKLLAEEFKKHYRPYYLFVGNRNMYKDFSMLIDSYSFLENPEYDIICAGGGEFTQDEINYMERKGVRKNFIHQKISNDNYLNYLYQQAISYISTSAYEGFGLPVLEAFNNNCPVILRDNQCYKEIAEDGADYFTSSDPQQLTDLMQKLFSDGIYRKGLKERGNVRLKYFNKEKLIKDTVACYRLAVKK